MEGAQQGPPVEFKQPTTLAELAELNRYDSIGRQIDLLLADGELDDYDSEIGNRLRDAARIARGICALANVPLSYQPK
jgi:hypothetical protein